LINVEEQGLHVHDEEDTVQWWHVKGRLLRYMSSDSLTAISKHDDDKLMFEITFLAVVAFGQTFSVLFTIYEVYAEGFPIYAAFSFVMYFVLPWIFTKEESDKLKEPILKTYFLRLTSFEAIRCVSRAWETYQKVNAIETFTIEEGQKSHEKILFMMDEKALLVSSSKHQKFEGMIALVTNILVMLHNDRLPPVSLLPAVLNTAKCFAEYDFDSKVIFAIADGRKPVIAGTITSGPLKAFLLLFRFLELVTVVLTTCLAHTITKESYELKRCPVIFIVPTSFLVLTALFANAEQVDKSLFTWAELFSGFFCFSGPLSLPWKVAYVNCKARTYYLLRFLNTVFCGMLIQTAVHHQPPEDEFTWGCLYVAGGSTACCFVLLVLINCCLVNNADPKDMPAKVLNAFIPDVAKNEVALPEEWATYKDILRQGYGLFAHELPGEAPCRRSG
jgi:hypothetical protein